MKYYLQNTQGGAYVGNSMKWWAHNDRGYTCDIRCAKIWSGEEYEKKKENLRECDIFWPKKPVDRLVQHHVDWQDLRKNDYGDYPAAPHTIQSYRPDLISVPFYVDEPKKRTESVSDIQKLVNVISDAGLYERKKYHLTLGRLIDNLMDFPVNLPVKFSNGGYPGSFGSYRGYYSDMYIDSDGDPINVGEFIKVVHSKMLGQTFEGYKGGDYKMGEDTPLWHAEYGLTSGNMGILGIELKGDHVEFVEKHI